MGGKFSHKLEVFLPWMLLNRNFLKENRYYSHAGWENFRAKIFPKLLLGQCTQIKMLSMTSTFARLQLVQNLCNRNYTLHCFFYQLVNTDHWYRSVVHDLRSTCLVRNPIFIIIIKTNYKIPRKYAPATLNSSNWSPV
jgi:hypothetical protein